MPDLFATPQLFKKLFFEANYKLMVCADPTEVRWLVWKMNRLREFFHDKQLAADLYYTSQDFDPDMEKEPQNVGMDQSTDGAGGEVVSAAARRRYGQREAAVGAGTCS